MLEYVTVNSECYAWDCYTLLCMSGLSLNDWRAKMTFWVNPADTMAIYALSDQYGLHTSIITKSKLWTTVSADYQGTEWDVLDISIIKLLYMGANRYGRIWKKAVADQPSFYGQNFNYQPMLPLNSVPSSTDVETACTLVQIGDSLPQYAHEEPISETPLFSGPNVDLHDDAMDKIVDRLDVCQWHPLNFKDAMDKVITPDTEECIQVETTSEQNKNCAIKVETKNCYVKLVRLDSILFDDTPDADNTKSKEGPDTSMTTPANLPRLRPRKRSARYTRHPRQASLNMDYNKPVVPLSPVKNKHGYVKNIKPNQSGPSANRIKAQTSHSTHPTTNLPGLPIPESNPYDGDTDLEDAPSANPVNTPTQVVDASASKKGTIIITSHTLMKKSNPRKYRCRMCDQVLDSTHELTTHHQATHNILYCSFCSKAFNNLLSLSRHEYEHQHRSLKCRKCDGTFTFKSQLKAHQFAHRTKPSFFCVYPNCGKAFFFETDLT